MSDKSKQDPCLSLSGDELAVNEATPPAAARPSRPPPIQRLTSSAEAANRIEGIELARLRRNLDAPAFLRPKRRLNGCRADAVSPSRKSTYFVLSIKIP